MSKRHSGVLSRARLQVCSALKAIQSREPFLSFRSGCIFHKHQEEVLGLCLKECQTKITALTYKNHIQANKTDIHPMISITSKVRPGDYNRFCPHSRSGGTQRPLRAKSWATGTVFFMAAIALALPKHYSLKLNIYHVTSPNSLFFCV